MRTLSEGEQRSRICNHCEKRVVAVYQCRDYIDPASDREVKGLLLGICTECDSVVSISAQSMPQIEAARRSR